MVVKATSADKVKAERKAALLARMHQSQQVSSGVRSYYKPGLDNVKFWAPKEGDHVFDIIPYSAGPDDPAVVLKRIKEGDLTYLLEIFIHRDVGGVENQSFICLAETYKRKCPICEHRMALRREGADEDLIKSLQPSRYPRSIYNVVVYDSEKDEAQGVQVFDTSHYLMEMYLAKLAKGSTRGGARPASEVAFSDPDEGKSIRFTRTGTKENTKFIAHAFEDRSYAISEEIMAQAHVLDSLLHIPAYGEVYRAYWGETPTDEALPPTEKMDGDEEAPAVEEAPRATRTRVQPKPAPDEPDEQEEEEETTPPADEPDSEDNAVAEALAAMDRAELKAYIAEHNLPITVYKEKPDGKYSDEWIRNEILAALGASTETEGEGEEEEEAPAPPARAQASKLKPKAGGATECPGGGVFGKNLNELQHCEACKVWEDCLTENERLTKAASAAGAKPPAPKRAVGPRK